ncbi:MAG: hypothetical protein GIKADHBN_02744 [Phycisphaerales bacterium]|nr:hypothetical protein [Phycisphaerales bacterium]
MSSILRALRVAAVAMLVSSHAAARPVDVVPPPEGGPTVTDLSLVGGKYELRDVSNGRLIMQQRNALPLVTVMDSQVTSTLKINEQPAGYDMVVTFTNPTNSQLRLGTIYVGMLTVGADIEYLDIRHTSIWRPASFSTFVGKGYTYPDDLYSPAYIIRGPEYAVGVSMRYPIIEYDHDVRVATMNPSGGNSGEGGPGWGAGFRLSNPDNCPPTQAMRHPGFLPAKTSRTYVVSVRVSRDRQDWMPTMLPYLKYFRGMYGGVSYKRDGRPILPVGIADSVNQEPGNLDGYGDPNIRRPDIFGWGPWADRLVDQQGYHSLMLWAPSGMYFHNPQYNYPFQITSRWNVLPTLATAFDPDIGLPRVRASGKTLGLWWGRSLDVSTVWDPATVTPLNPNNPVHVQLAREEIEGAVDAGVGLIGLDTCNPSINGIRNAYTWIKYLRENYPDMRFIAEPSPCDILHSLIGGVLPGWTTETTPKTLAECYPYRNPHYMADLLLPGHESVMSYRYNNQADYFDYTPSDLEVDQDIRWFASMGYTPMLWTPVETAGDVVAAESWMWTVPGWMRNIYGEGSGADDQGSSGGDKADKSAGGHAGDKDGMKAEVK